MSYRLTVDPGDFKGWFAVEERGAGGVRGPIRPSIVLGGGLGRGNALELSEMPRELRIVSDDPTADLSGIKLRLLGPWSTSNE